MGWYDIYSADAISTYRVLRKRIYKHPIMAIWFIILMIAFAWIVLRTYEFSMRQGEEGIFTDIEPNTLLLIIFFIFLAKSVADTTRRVAQNKALIFYLSQPIRKRNVLFGKFFSELVFNLLLFETMVGVMLLVIIISGIHIPLDLWYLGYAFILSTLGTSLGFSFSIFNALRPFSRRFIVMLAQGPFFIAVYSITMDLYQSLVHWPLFLVLITLSFASLLLLLLCQKVFLDSWTFGTSASEGVKKSVYDIFSRSPLVPARLMDERLRALVRRELAEKVRSGAIWGTVITVIAITWGTKYAIDTLADVDLLQMSTGKYVYPLLVGMGIFAVSTLEPGISSLSGIGREGKNIWILKTAPFGGSLVAKAKALSNAAISPLIVFGTALFSAYYISYYTEIKLMNYSFLEVAVFSVLAAQTMIFLFIGLGCWFGAKYPNFDESNKGNPDIMTMYIFAMSCLILGALFITAPFYLMIRQYNVLGLLAMILSLDIAALFLYFAAERGGKRLDRLEYG
ncbi:MAG: hypothetical protein JSV56_03480 [Methanomassiliicoccales archaeon]|nr:MAG: hypothetical protein JSV56_03480 [Methanomassiliicoccales archaeon]